MSGKEATQIGNGISNPVIAGIVYWLIRILICGGCLAVEGILVTIIGIKVAGLYKKYCWDMITIMVTLICTAVTICFRDWIKTVLSINLLFLLLLVTGSICWSKMVYKGLARSQRIYLATLSIRNVQLLLMRKMLRKLGCRPVTAGNIILKPKFLKKQQINLQYDVRKQNELKTGRDFPNNKFLNRN